MAQRRRSAIVLVVVVLVLTSLFMAFPAAGDPESCPNAWTWEPNLSTSDREDNSNSMVCTKDVNGNGNQRDGNNLKDDRRQRDPAL